MFDKGSFRDRTGRVFHADDQIFRAVTREGLDNWKAVSRKRFVKSAMECGRIVQTRVADANERPVEEAFSGDDSDDWRGILRHERIPLISYPYEWCFSMLRDAAMLQLGLMQQSLEEDAILKDATPYNIQFRGTQPVFIDIPSLIPLRDGQMWEGYRQFCQMFLFPLMLQAYRGVDFQPWLRGRLEGITPTEINGLLSVRDCLRRGVLTHVWIHAWLQRRQNRMRAETSASGLPSALRSAGFQKSLIDRNVRKLAQIVEGLRWNCPRSLWSEYDHQPSPASTDGRAKEQFVRKILSAQRWKCVWDLGCNQGRYSLLAAEHAELVVAMDSDHLTVEQLYLTLRRQQEKRIIPLVMNLADPSPNLGWRCQERNTITERSQPDMILCLAVIHHLVFRENLLLQDVIHWLADRRAAMIIEYVDRSDPQVQSLLAHRDDQFRDYSLPSFLRAVAARFDIQQQIDLPSTTRTLFHVVPRHHRADS